MGRLYLASSLTLILCGALGVVPLFLAGAISRALSPLEAEGAEFSAAAEGARATPIHTLTWGCVRLFRCQTESFLLPYGRFDPLSR
jgi:hypothetical protein